MTIKEAKEVVKALGLRLRWQSEYKEFRVLNPINGATYFTPDMNDAIGTAKMMAKEVSK